MSKRSTIWQAGLTLALVTGLVLSGLALAAEAPPGAQVTYLKGKVFVKRGGGDYAQIQKGSKLKAGDQVKTSKKSRLEIRLADNSVIRLGSRSNLTLEQSLFKSGEHKQVSGKLWRGKAYAVVSKLVGEKSSFEIRTGTAVAGVRGTAFRIDAKSDKSTVVRVYTGAVAVSNAPIYAKPGKPKKTGKTGAFTMPKQGVKPGGPGRVEVAGPSEVTKKEWEEFVAKAMQEVRVAGDGKISAPVAFSAKKDAADEWVAWNQSMDKRMK